MECSICMGERVRSPVVTRCGHLFCWPCIYTWLYMQQQQTQFSSCPICKGALSLHVGHNSFTPVYAPGSQDEEDEDADEGKEAEVCIPPRPNIAHIYKAEPEIDEQSVAETEDAPSEIETEDMAQGGANDQDMAQGGTQDNMAQGGSEEEQSYIQDEDARMREIVDALSQQFEANMYPSYMNQHYPYNEGRTSGNAWTRDRANYISPMHPQLEGANYISPMHPQLEGANYISPMHPQLEGANYIYPMHPQLEANTQPSYINQNYQYNGGTMASSNTWSYQLPIHLGNFSIQFTLPSLYSQPYTQIISATNIPPPNVAHTPTTYYPPTI